MKLNESESLRFPLCLQLFYLNLKGISHTVMSSAPANKDYLLSGYLVKKGDKGLTKSWKRRFFCLRHGSTFIEYYRNPGDECLGRIDVNQISTLSLCDIEFARKERVQHPFRLVTPGRIYYLGAQNDSAIQYWMNGINEVILLRVKKSPEQNNANSNNNIVITNGKQTNQVNNIDNEQANENSNNQENNVNVLSNGILSVTIKQAEQLNVSKERGHLGVYCMISMEKQLIKTQILNDLKNIFWDENFLFDITSIDIPNKKNELTISLWAQDSSQTGGQSLGQVTIGLEPLYNETPLDEVFNLQSTDTSNRSRGKLHVLMTFTPYYKKIGKDDFNILKVIGKGNFGKVMQVKKKDTGRIYAMKVLRKDRIIAADAVQHTMSESNVLRRIHHPFIVTLKYTFQTKEKLYIVMDYLSGGELFYHLSQIDRFEEDRAKFYAAEIVEALGHLHENGIVYRDLKPENLLLDISGHVCLTDFGLVKEGVNHGDVTTTFCGSPEYLAPEIILGNAYGKEVDWWSLGTFLYEMLQGLPPFYDEDVFEMNRKIVSAPLQFDPEIFSPEAKSLIRSLLQRDPKLRIGSGKEGHKEIKSHPFFSSIDWNKLLKKEIEPPYKPHLRNEEDVRYFDKEFTEQTPQDTPCFHSKYLMDGNLFDGFSYASNKGGDLMAKKVQTTSYR